MDAGETLVLDAIRYINEERRAAGVRVVGADFSPCGGKWMERMQWLSKAAGDCLKLRRR